MALVSGLLAAANQTRLWFEWVPTDQNASDGLSRDGFENPVVKKKLRTGEWIQFQPVEPCEDIAGSDLRHALTLVRRWEECESH